MNREDILGGVMIGFVLMFSLKIYFESDAFNLKCIYSDVDGKKYCVREREKMGEAADLLAKVTNKCSKMVKIMGEKFPDKDNCTRLVKGYKSNAIKETLPTSELTAYSENKGEKIAFCLNTTKHGNKLIDENTLTFVALHELSHIMTSTIGHTSEFWNNFKFLIENSIEAGVYNPVDYKKNPVSYCGMNLNDNPYYDLK